MRIGEDREVPHGAVSKGLGVGAYVHGAIRNEGEQRIPIVTPSGLLKAMTFQACDATKPLASVKRMMDAGHAVVFAPDELGGSFILNLHSGEDEPLVEEDGNYYMDVWVPPPSALPFVRQP